MPVEIPLKANPFVVRTPEVRLDLLLSRIILLTLGVGLTAVHLGFRRPPLDPHWTIVIKLIIFVVYCLDVWISPFLGRLALRDQKPDWIDAVITLLGLVGGVLGLFVDKNGWYLFDLALFFFLLSEAWRLLVGLSRRYYRAGLVTPISFLVLIILGTLLIKLPLAIPRGHSLSWLDALFTMTSAVCVTGLVVRDTATEFTPLGQAIIAVFIQLGGLGIIIFGSVVAMMMGTRLSLRENLSLRAMLHNIPLARLTSFVRFVVLSTIVFELIGAALMYSIWHGELSIEHRWGLSLFHAVSAFCNAGFSNVSGNLVGYRYSPLAHLIVLPLLVLGGLGAPVLYNLWQIISRSLKRPWSRANQRTLDAPRRLSLHAKLVLATTAGLYLYGVVGLAAGQIMPYLYEGMGLGYSAYQTRPESLGVSTVAGILADSSFMSLTARTAGFNTVPMDQVSPAGRFVLMTLMAVGGSPGSTAGGMKTVTLAVFLLTVAAAMRRLDRTEAFGRSIADDLVRRAITIAACFLALICFSTLLLSLSEPFPFQKLLFEAVSAASTTGLSLGVTSDLTAFGKLVVIATMFLGRIGPLTLLVGLTFRARPPRSYLYPAEEVVLS